MSEVNRLRQRLKNVQKNVTEYRMTVAEARNLLAEIDELLKRPVELPAVVVKEAPEQSRIIDGGVF